jgi:hypothetical protein
MVISKENTTYCTSTSLSKICHRTMYKYQGYILLLAAVPGAVVSSRILFFLRVFTDIVY